MLGTARSWIASSGANARALVRATGGVCGRSRQKAASTSEAIPETRNVLGQRRLHRRAGLQRRERLCPARRRTRPACAIAGTFAQSIGMKMNGQLAAIQPIVPQSRIEPKSFCASFRLANAIALVTESVGT